MSPIQTSVTARKEILKTRSFGVPGAMRLATSQVTGEQTMWKKALSLLSGCVLRRSTSQPRPT